MTETIDRRTLVRGATWSAPAVVMAAQAPASAASPCTRQVCQTQTIDWDVVANYSSPSTTQGTYTLPITGKAASGSSALVMSISSTFYRNMRSGVRGSTASAYPGATFDRNLRRTRDTTYDPLSVGSTGWGLMLHQTVDAGRTDITNLNAGSRADRQEVRFTFSERVCSLTFGIWDLDAVQGDFIDAVDLAATDPFTVVRGSALQGSGTAADPWRAPAWGDRSPSEAANRVQISFPSGVQSFAVNYWNLETARTLDGDHRVFFDDMVVGITKVVSC